MQRREEGSDEETAAPRIIARHRAADSDEDEVAGDVPRPRQQREDEEEEEDDDEDREARRAAVRERCVIFPGDLFFFKSIWVQQLQALTQESGLAGVLVLNQFAF